MRLYNSLIKMLLVVLVAAGLGLAGPTSSANAASPSSSAVGTTAFRAAVNYNWVSQGKANFSNTPFRIPVWRSASYSAAKMVVRRLGGKAFYTKIFLKWERPGSKTIRKTISRRNVTRIAVIAPLKRGYGLTANFYAGLKRGNVIKYNHVGLHGF